MQACIIGNSEMIGLAARQVLLREGQDCPASHVLSLDLAAEQLSRLRPELAVVVLSPDVEKSLTALSKLRAQTSARFIAIGPTTSSNFILRALHAGASDYVDETELETGLLEALLRMRAEAPAQLEEGRTIAVLSPSGGGGSSTLAVNLATILAKDHKSVALFDLKLFAGDLAPLLDLKPAHSLAELCQNSARMDRIMLERSLTRHSSGVHLLAPAQSYADVSLVTVEGVLQALKLARGIFPYVIVDLDHSFREEQVQVLRQADLVLVVFRLDFTSLRNAQKTMDYLDYLGINKERIRLIANRYGQPKEIPAAKAEEALGVKIFHYVPDDPKTVNRANNNGIPVVLESPSAKVSRSMANLAGQVNGRHVKQ